MLTFLIILCTLVGIGLFAFYPMHWPIWAFVMLFLVFCKVTKGPQ